jgi:hypothetical protein
MRLAPAPQVICGALDIEIGALVWPHGADSDPATVHDWPAVAEAFARLAATSWRRGKPRRSRARPGGPADRRVHIGEPCLIVALGIAADGQKHALGLWDGSTENARVCQDLLANLQSRGLCTDRSVLVIWRAEPDSVFLIKAS